MSQRVLVSGVTGYIGAHVCKDLLENGSYVVRGTVRQLDNPKHQAFKQCFAAAISAGKLELVQADLLDEKSWLGACADCTYVCHVASPFVLGVTDKEAEEKLFRPARDGALNVLKAAHAAGTVKRVVLTSSMAAVSAGHENKAYDQPEESWSNIEKADNYSKSKTMSERAAWDYINGLHESKSSTMELATINPCLVCGPALMNTGATSHELIVRLLNRQMPMVPDLGMYVVDVREVAAAHRLALEVKEAAGQRFACVSEPINVLSLAKFYDQKFGPLGYSVPTTELPYFVAWCASWFDSGLATVLPRIGAKTHEINNSKIRDILGVKFRGWKECMADHAASIIELGIGGTKKTDAYVKQATATAAATTKDAKN